MTSLRTLWWWQNWTQERDRSEEMGEIIMRNWDLREFRVSVNLPSPIQQVPVPVSWVITPIPGHLYPTRQVRQLISHIHSYPLYRSHLYPPSLSCSSTTRPLSPELIVESSLPISPCHEHELLPSAAFSKYSINLQLAILPLFSRLRVDSGM